MTDVHSHILFGIDDGSSSILESLELISKMKRAGFDKIILTPHYIEGTEYSAENKEKLERYELLKKEIDRIEWLEIESIGTKYVVKVEERIKSDDGTRYTLEDVKRYIKNRKIK